MHGRLDFARENQSINHIDSILGTFKGMITKFYNDLKPDNFVYFLRELEFRYNTHIINKYDQMKELKSILEYCFNTCYYKFYEIKDLNDFSKDNYSYSHEEEDED